MIHGKNISETCDGDKSRTPFLKECSVSVKSDLLIPRNAAHLSEEDTKTIMI